MRDTTSQEELSVAIVKPNVLLVANVAQGDGPRRAGRSPKLENPVSVVQAVGQPRD